MSTASLMQKQRHVEAIGAVGNAVRLRASTTRLSGRRRFRRKRAQLTLDSRSSRRTRQDTRMFPLAGGNSTNGTNAGVRTMRFRLRQPPSSTQETVLYQPV